MFQPFTLPSAWKIARPLLSVLKFFNWKMVNYFLKKLYRTKSID